MRLMGLMRIALWGPLLVAALLLGAYIYVHDPFARDGTELFQVPLSEEDSIQSQMRRRLLLPQEM